MAFDAHSQRLRREATIVAWVARCAVAALIVLLLILVSRCAFNSDGAKRSVDTDTAIFSAQQRVRQHLRDPASAEFSGVAVSTKLGKAVCGSVNARNGFGGMSGAKRFVVAEEVWIEAEVPAAGFLERWAARC